MSEYAPSPALPSGFVALVGQPNVGKSTLMNAILEIKVAIITSKPQTTRNRILGVQTYPEKGQICFVDTPGIHRSNRRLNRAMTDKALRSAQEVDLVCHIVDAPRIVGWQKKGGDARLPPEEEFVMERLVERDIDAVLVLNKIDLVDEKLELLPLIEMLTEANDYRDVVPVSALTGENQDKLVDVILEHLPEQGMLFPEEMLTDKAERFIAAEFVREQAMDQTRREVPYSVAVEVERFRDDEQRDVLEITAVLHVERESQKGILIGKGGRRIKEIGEQARGELEKFFGKKVYLETLVRVEPGWSENPRFLRRFDYE